MSASAGPDSVIITIDGPAGTGKSTVAAELAQRLGVEFLDTGAMYRAAALLALEKGIDPADGPVVAAAVRAAGIRFDFTTARPTIRLGGEDVSRRIRDLDVSEVVSAVAGCSEVRTEMVREQRLIAAAHPRLVTEGRDQGSVVFPDADVRFFLDADSEVRAERRLAQLRHAGKSVDVGVVRADIERRDRLDMSRSDGPLIRPVGAVEVDTTELTLDETIERLESIVRDRLPSTRLRAPEHS